ncbi:hypothetical protein ACO2XV_01430 [Escherichia coli]
MDRYTPPFFGRRRGWLLATQILLLVAIAAMGFLEPGAQLRWMAALAVVIAFCSASQDIVFDAWKTDVLPAEERGAGAAMSVLGLRFRDAGFRRPGLWLADKWLGWQGMYWLMAALFDPLYYRDVACTRTNRHHSCAQNAGTSGCCTSANLLVAIMPGLFCFLSHV